ncbi:MAG: hypothetical protein KGI84_00220 [Elusimicrobia bacterium]|nr:hypothetical protein [Elusimicrobiota bacterium]
MDLLFSASARFLFVNARDGRDPERDEPESALDGASAGRARPGRKRKGKQRRRVR